MNTPTHHNIPAPDDLLAVAVEAARRGGAVMRQHRDAQTVSVTLKGRFDLVTNADIAAEKAVLETLHAHFPDHTILAEESAPSVNPETLAKGVVWVIDPIDGTTNYAHGHLHVACAVGCVVDGVCMAGAVYAPFLEELFTATKGGGATLNGAPIRTSTASKIEQALMATGFPYDRSNVANICNRIAAVLRRCRDIRRNGAAALDICGVACGRLDAYWEETVRPWDATAACLIAREAGAHMGHFPYDSPSQRLSEGYPGDLYVDNLIVSAPGIFEEVKGVLEQAGRTEHVVMVSGGE